MIDVMRVRWVALDFVDTLAIPAPSVGEVYYNIGRKYGSRLSLEEVTAGFRRAFVATEQSPASSENEQADPWRTDEAQEFARWQKIVELVLTDVVAPTSCFQELYDHFARPAAWKVFPDVSTALQRFEQAGWNIALASNFDHRLNEVCDGHPLLRGLTRRLISAEMGTRKPSPRFFESLLLELKCRPSEVLMIGDHPQNDYAAPLQSGLSALLLDRKGTVPGPHSFQTLHAICDYLGI